MKEKEEEEEEQKKKNSEPLSLLWGEKRLHTYVSSETEERKERRQNAQINAILFRDLHDLHSVVLI